MKKLLPRTGIALLLGLAFTLLFTFFFEVKGDLSAAIFWQQVGVRILFFLGIDGLYSLMRPWWRLAGREPGVPIAHYAGVVVVFAALSLVFFWGLHSFFFDYLAGKPGDMFRFPIDKRGLYYNTAIILGLYFLVRAFFDTLGQLQQASLEVERYEREKAQTHLAMLKSQISPHFLFNSLNALSSLIYTDEEKAVRFVDELAAIFRYVLENKDQELVPLRAELDFLNAYLYLLKIRFRDNLQVNMTIPAQLLPACLPPLTLQLLVENAIKHNIVSREEPLCVDLRAEDDTLIVRNNLQPREKATNSTGVGLRNIIQRYRYLSSRPVEILQTTTEFIARIPLLTVQEHD